MSGDSHSKEPSLLVLLLAGLSLGCAAGEFKSALPAFNISSDAIQPNSRKWRITVCAMVRDEIPYLFEWIEFHRLQGVDHFILYDDEGTDDTYLLPLLYQSHGFPDLVEVIPANFRRKNRFSDHAYWDYLGSQKSSMNHCNQRLINQTHFLMAIDVDEYMFSPRYPTVWDYLLSQRERITPKPKSKGIANFMAPSLRFGTSNMDHEFKGRIRTKWSTGHLTAEVDLVSGSVPLLMLGNPARAPHPELDADYTARFNVICANRTDNGSACTHAAGKSIWIPERCSKAGIHFCEKHIGEYEGTSFSAADLRVNHYAIRSATHAHNLIPWLRPWKEKLLGPLDIDWFSSRSDTAIQRFAERVRNSMERLIIPGG